jgi:hypothetical protein
MPELCCLLECCLVPLRPRRAASHPSLQALHLQVARPLLGLWVRSQPQRCACCGDLAALNRSPHRGRSQAGKPPSGALLREKNSGSLPVGPTFVGRHTLPWPSQGVGLSCTQRYLHRCVRAALLWGPSSTPPRGGPWHWLRAQLPATRMLQFSRAPSMFGLDARLAPCDVTKLIIVLLRSVFDPYARVFRKRATTTQRS